MIGMDAYVVYRLGVAVSVAIRVDVGIGSGIGWDDIREKG
jgi:hypothetical protein